jgi:hypothetical protein
LLQILKEVEGLYERALEGLSILSQLLHGEQVRAPGAALDRVTFNSFPVAALDLERPLPQPDALPFNSFPVAAKIRKDLGA